ncbi:hypothetical protein R1sor_026548 [Riccia sorocarpa]|uniref:Reverse transcriptase domain-containing protein n=1 Tax=Riccia sorocarpa TaxID=122646 RepID=A0ABD3GF01_9MARC
MDNILSFWLTQDNLQQQQRSGLFLKLDFEKAFYGIEQDFIWDSMTKLGIGEKYIQLVKGLTEGAQTSIHINGFFSRRRPAEPPQVFDSHHRQECPGPRVAN